MKKQFAFVCNNYYHLMVSTDIANNISGHKDLFLFGRIRNLENSDYLKNENWRYKTSWYSDSSVKQLVSYKNEYVMKKLKALSDIEYDYIFFFVDKDLPNQILLRLQKRAVKILIEEGIGLYNGGNKITLRKILLTILCMLKFKIIIKHKGNEQGANKYHEYLILRTPSLLPINKLGPKLYKFEKSLKAEKLFNNIEANLDNEDSKSIVLIGSAMSDVPVSMDKEIELLNECLGIFINKGYEIYLKKHPREPDNKYNKLNVKYKELNTSSPVEVLVGSLQPSFVISIMSSAILNINDLFSNVKGIYLYKLVNAKFANKDTLEKINIGKNVFHPSNISELNKLIFKSETRCDSSKDSEEKSISDCVLEIISKKGSTERI